MIRVLIADDFPQMVTVMQRLIERADDMRVAGIVTDFRDVVAQILNIEHEVILMNDYLPPTTSVNATKRLREMGVISPIVVISMQHDPQLIRDALAAGANGFILKEEFLNHLLPAIRSVHEDEQYLSPLANSLLQNDG
ncbi:MAG: response regulator [Chloroflexota bacterium]